MDFTDNSVSGVFLQCPDTQGFVYDLTSFVNQAHANNVRILYQIEIKSFIHLLGLVPFLKRLMTGISYSYS